MCREHSVPWFGRDFVEYKTQVINKLLPQKRYDKIKFYE